MIIREPFKVSKFLSLVPSYVLFHFFGNTFRAENSQFFKFLEIFSNDDGNMSNIKMNVKSNIFGQKITFLVQLKVAILTYHAEKLVRVQAALKLLRTRVSADDTR